MVANEALQDGKISLANILTSIHLCCSRPRFHGNQLLFLLLLLLLFFFSYCKSSIKPPSLLSPPPPPSPNPYSSQKNKRLTWADQLCVHSGWKFILFLVFGGMTSNFICLTFSILFSRSLWRIATIFLSLDKAVYRPGTTSPSSRNLAPVSENSKLRFCYF